MRINVIGGGPAGLYFALLMRRHGVAREVAVYERNPPAATFRWGVVFSGRTRRNLREADEVSHRRITESFETWDNVDVVLRDAKVTVRGNDFSGIARLKLLNILQERCAEVGVELLFHGLTLTFRETEAGVFAAHSYKFGKELSTFIVECDEETWRGAGLERMGDAEAREYLGRVFARDLEGEELLSNNSRWINFLLVKNGRWSRGNVVLLGDALHTAHFSIGSGTKLAIEDSIELFRHFAAGATVPAALEAFERERRPVVEEYQRAADESRVWFERAREHVRMEPLPFAYSLMTRSTRVDRESLRRRDPTFVAAFEEAAARR